jgi:hypothetical protein
VQHKFRARSIFFINRWLMGARGAVRINPLVAC